MIEKRLRVSDIQTIMSCSRQTATKFMRQMVHTEKPLTVTESAFHAWEAKRTIDPEKAVRRPKKSQIRRIPDADWKVPRRREV